MMSEMVNMLDDMRKRGFSLCTLESYAMHVRQFLGFIDAQLSSLGESQIREHLLVVIARDVSNSYSAGMSKKNRPYCFIRVAWVY